ncbi:hypothetical protein CDAR_43761 [Caerostris darwini]|uniref:Uncharacterized protein n=1 Tax=Caerostris darwini TaxID=1538125 RepID=A0AAV4WJJ5_9ARAC|nr:hypothetical protein CDAR_43761 [Caerostris darwini]
MHLATRTTVSMATAACTRLPNQASTSLIYAVLANGCVPANERFSENVHLALSNYIFTPVFRDIYLLIFRAKGAFRVILIPRFLYSRPNFCTSSFRFSALLLLHQIMQYLFVLRICHFYTRAFVGLLQILIVIIMLLATCMAA